MKNKILRHIIQLFLILSFLITPIYAQNFEFEAANIETINEDFISASKDVIIKNNNGIEISGESLLFDKKNKIFTISDKVIFKDLNNSILINAEKIIFDEIENIVRTFGVSKIIKEDTYIVQGDDIFFDRNEKKIFSEKPTIIKDFSGNTFEIEKLQIYLNDNLLIADNSNLIDKDLNVYSIKNLYFNFKSKKLIGKDIVVNKDNKISNKKNLPRVKSRSLLIENDKVNFQKSVYTNCEKREGCPPWLIQAEEIEHDNKEKIIKYKNALLKIYDIPILYFPKFFHPDPTVKRQSGFLTPSISANSLNGYVKTPYFFEISDNSDFTFSPRFYDNQKTLFQGEYRLLTKNSNHIFDTSIQNDELSFSNDNNSKSHFFSRSSINTNLSFFDFSKIDLQIQSTSNDKYLKSYNINSPIIDSQNTLNSKFNFLASNENLDLSISTEVYEDLSKQNDNDKYEYILPNFNFTKLFNTKLEGSLTMTNMGYNKIFDTNINEKILINNFSYTSLDKITDFGLINNYELLVKNFNADSKNSKNYKNETESDLQGILQFNSKLPLKKEGYNFSSSLTPIFVAKLSPFKNKNLRDSDRLVDYNNFYSINRISSNESLEGDSSITIGNEFKIFNNSNLDNEILAFNLATSFRDKVNHDLPTKSSLGQKTSNIAGQINLNANNFLNINYDFLSDNNLGQMNYHKLNSTLKVNNFVSSFEFIEENNDIGNESFVANETSYEFDQNKSLKFRTRKNRKTNLTEYYNLIYQYKMDCLTAGLEYKKNYYSDGDIKPEESLFFSITLMPFGSSIDLPSVK